MQSPDIILITVCDFYPNERLNIKLRCDENSKNKQSNQNQKDSKEYFCFFY